MRLTQAASTPKCVLAHDGDEPGRLGPGCGDLVVGLAELPGGLVEQGRRGLLITGPQRLQAVARVVGRRADLAAGGERGDAEPDQGDEDEPTDGDGREQ